METTNICPRCGKEIKADSQFCPFCGMAIPQDPGGSGNEERDPIKAITHGKFSWLWIFTFLGIMHVMDALAAFLLSAGFSVPPRSVQELPQFVLIPAATFMFFLAGLTTALLSPGKTLSEPTIGAAMYVIFSMLLNLDFTGAILGWIGPLFIAWAGASSGEYISARYQKRHKNSSNLSQLQDRQPRQTSTRQQVEATSDV